MQRTGHPVARDNSAGFALVDAALRTRGSVLRDRRPAFRILPATFVQSLLCAGAKKLLERLNYDVTTETSATAAVQRFKADARGFDLVLTDLNMPVMSGVDVATELLKAKPGTPVVLATGFNADLTTEAVRAIGIRELVVKPLSAGELARRVHAALQQR